MVDFGPHTEIFIPFISNGEDILLYNSGTKSSRDSGVGGVRPNLGALKAPVLDPCLYMGGTVGKAAPELVGVELGSNSL